MTRSNLKINHFTLVEVVAATGVSLMIAMIIAMASLSFHRTYTKSEKHTSALRENMNIDLIVDSCFRNIIPFRWNNDEGSSQLVFEGLPDEIFFVCLRRSIGMDTGALIFMKIYLEDGKLYADYSSLPRFPWMTNSTEYPMTKEIISENVKSVSFKYAERLSSNSVEWLDTWDEDQNPDIPIAVLMKIEWSDGRTEQWLRRTAGASANSTYGNRETSVINQ